MTSPRRLSRPGLEVRHLLLLIPWVVVGIVARSPIRDNSFLWHIRAGTRQIDLGSVLTSDPFSFTASGWPWRTQSWLADLLYGQMERWFGLGFVWVMVSSAGVLTLGALLLVASRRIAAISLRGIYLVVSAVVLAGYLNPRPALFSLVLLGMLVLAVEERRLWWAIPLLFWLWAAVHGSWAVGIGYVALQSLATRDRALARNLLPSGVAVLLTAHGWGVVDVLVQFVQNRSALALITEWAPTNLAGAGAFPILLGLLLLVLPARRGRVAPSALWVLIPFVYLAASSTRSVPLTWLVVGPFFALIAADIAEPKWLLSAGRGKRLFNLVLAGVIVLLPFVLARQPFLDAEHFPVAAASHLSGRVFHDDTAGGYLIYEQWPDRLVFIDDRAELFGSLIEDFVKARNASDEWDLILGSYGIEQALLRQNEPLSQLLRSEGWSEVFRDQTYVVLNRPAAG